MSAIRCVSGRDKFETIPLAGRKKMNQKIDKYLKSMAAVVTLAGSLPAYSIANTTAITVSSSAIFLGVYLFGGFVVLCATLLLALTVIG